MQKRILIAEDEQIARETLTDIATKHGYDVTAVTNGVDLLSVAAVERFDVVITDLLMADLDGVAAANIMKMRGDTTPVIAITGVSVDKINCIKDSFARIYQKPVNVRELFEYVESLIGK